MSNQYEGVVISIVHKRKRFSTIGEKSSLGRKSQGRAELKTALMSDEITIKPLILRPVSFERGSENQRRFHNGWHEPLLDLYSRPVTFPPKTPEIPKLYLVPTPDFLEGEEGDPDAVRKATPLTELPKLDEWVGKYLVSVVEIYGGKRPLHQVARWTHRLIYQQLAVAVGSWKVLPKIRKMYISEPLEGIAEVSVTLRFDQRVRSLVMRFEGVDHRWLCTKLELI